MTKPTFFLTEVAQDWSERNLTVVQQAVLEAERATLARSDVRADPLLDTPNLPNLRGVIRWHMVQKQLAMAAERGSFDGITAEWVELGGVSVLELRGRYTSVTTHHLMEENDAPRESMFRRRGREVNEVSPVLRGLEGWAEEASRLIQLVLVHGGKSSEFAYLRAYTDPDNRAVYRQLSRNIKLMPMLVPSIEFEPVSEPVVELSPAAEQKKRASGEAS